MGEKVLALVFSLAILGNAVFMRRLIGTWVFPAALFALFWFLMTFIPLVGLFDAPANPMAIMYIFLATVVFSVSSLVHFRWRHAFRVNQDKPEPADYFNTRFLRRLFVAMSAGSLLCFIWGMQAQGFTVYGMLFTMLDTASSYAAMRYAEALESTVSARLSLVLAYMAVTIGGLLFGSARSRWQKGTTLFLSFLPAITAMLFQSAKGLLFLFVALFFAGILVTRIFTGRIYLFDAGTVRAGAIAVAVILPLVMLSFMGRGLAGIEDTSVVSASLSNYTATYAFGHLYAFADWFSYRIGYTSALPYHADPTGYGYYTFMSVFKALGSARTVPLGIYDDYYLWGDVLNTNIFTIFRGLIIDFGLWGTMLYMFVSGLLIHLAFYMLLVSRRPGFSVALFIFAIGYIYQSFVISMLTWNIIPVVALGLGCCLYLNGRRLRFA